MQTVTNTSANIYSYYNKRLLASAQKNLVYVGLGMQSMQPKGYGTDQFILRYGNVSASTTAITEGVTPSESSIATNKYTVTAAQYAQYISYTDWLDMLAVDDVKDNLVDRLGYTAALSADTIVRDNLIANATTNLQYVGSGNSVDNDIAANEVFQGQDVLKATRILRANDAPDMDGFYTWVVHPFIAHDLEADTSVGSWSEQNKYVNDISTKPVDGFVGKLYGTKVLQSSNVASAANSGSVNVYRSMIFAKDSFAFTKFDKNHIRLIVKGTDSGGIANPLELKATVGYKMQFGVKYLGGSFTNHNGASPDLIIQLRGAATGG